MSRTHVQIMPLNPEDPVALGDFELLGRIGQGGMGQVYLGESLGGEPAAVKVIKPSVVDSESRKRFAQEVEALKTIYGARIAAFLQADAERSSRGWPRSTSTARTWHGMSRHTVRCRPSSRRRSARSSPRHCPGCTTRDCCTGTSSRRTCCWARTGR